MKRRSVVLAILLCGGLAYAGVKAGSTITVRVMSAKVMSTPTFIGAAAGAVSRGDQLKVEEVKGDWYRVSGAATGWINKSAVIEGDVKLSTTPGGGGAGASRDEVELAGRGFTPQIESQYRQSNPNMDFSYVDAIEKTSVDPGSLAQFAQEGGLK